MKHVIQKKCETLPFILERMSIVLGLTTLDVPSPSPFGFLALVFDLALETFNYHFRKF